MEKIILMIAISVLAIALLTADDQPQTNPFDRFDRQIEKLKDKKEKAIKGAIIKGMENEIQKQNDMRANTLKRLTAPLEKERAALSSEVIKQIAKDKNADVAAKQAKVDYLQKMIQYYNDLSSSIKAEMPKDPAKVAASKVKTAVTADKGADNKPGDSEK